MAASDWRLELRDLAGSVLVSSIPAKSVKAGWALGGNGSLDFVVPIKSCTRTNYLPRAREVRLYRGSNLCWGGDLMVAQIQGRDDVLFNAQGWLQRLADRLITADTGAAYATPTEQVEIIWGLINTANGIYPTGITRGQTAGAAATGVTRKAVWCGYDRVVLLEAINQIAHADDGVDYLVTPTPSDSTVRKWWTFSPRKQAATGIVLTDTTHLMQNLQYTEDGMEMHTELSVLGPCRDQANCPGDVKVQVIGGVDGTYGLIQQAIQVEPRDPAHQLALGREEYRNRKQAMWRMDVRLSSATQPTWGTYSPGDTVTVQMSRGYATFNRDFRIVEMGVELAGRIETITLKLDGVIS